MNTDIAWNVVKATMALPTVSTRKQLNVVIAIGLGTRVNGADTITEGSAKYAVVNFVMLKLLVSSLKNRILVLCRAITNVWH